MKYYVLFFVILIGLSGCGAQKTGSIPRGDQSTVSADSKTLDESRVLYLLDGKVISKEAVNEIDPDTIEKIDVIKNKEEILKYTTEEYDGIVAIYLKKRK